MRKLTSDDYCVICGGPAHHRHHGIRRSHLGSDEEWNLYPMCAIHHRAYHDGILWVVRAVERLQSLREDARS